MAANKYSGADALRKFWDRISGHIVAINNRLDDVPDQGEVDELKAALANKLDDNLGTRYAGKLLYCGTDGAVTVLSVGRGLSIVNGALVVTSAPVSSAVCGEFVCGTINVGA